jgi:hypothetical protein
MSQRVPEVARTSVGQCDLLMPDRPVVRFFELLETAHRLDHYLHGVTVVAALAQGRANPQLGASAIARAEPAVRSKRLVAFGSWSQPPTHLIDNGQCQFHLCCPGIGDLSEADVLTVAMLLGANATERELALGSVTRSRSPTDWDGRPCLEWGLADLEAEACELRIVAGEVLPPALQTQAYAGAVLAAQAVVLSEHRLPYDRTLR